MSRVSIRQRDMMDCGAACLASVAAYYRLRLPVSRVRQYAGTDRRGTNVAGMIEAAERLGFRAKGVKGGADSLAQVPLPAIAHVKTASGQHHYVVIYKVHPRRILLMDPVRGALYREKMTAFMAVWTGALVLLLPGAGFRAGDERVSPVRRFWELVRPHTGIMVQALAGAVAYTVLGLSASVYLQKIIDHVLPEGNTRLLNLLGVIMTGILVFQLVIGHIRNVFALRTGQHIDARLVLGYYRHLLQLPQRFFDTMQVGEVLSRVNDAVRIRMFINDIALGIIVHACTVALAVCLMFLYYWKLALVTALIVPFYAFLYWISNRSHRKWQRRLMEDQAALEAQLVESLHAAGTIKRLGLEEDAVQRAEGKFVRLLRTVYAASIRTLYAGEASDFITKLFTVILLWCGSYFVIGRELSPGELLSFYALLGYFTIPAMQLIGASRNVQEALIAADRLYEIIDLETEADRPETTTLTKEQTGDIRLHGVHFRYGTRSSVFRGLDMHIPKGAYAAVVGESGCGKSTLPALLQGLYPLQEGTVTIGGHDIRHLTRASLRRIVGVVPQHTDLFAATIVENIAAGDPSPDMQHIVRLAQLLGVDTFIETLPGSYFTQLQAHGADLSGGQRQRLSIARALYREPEILVLDEATSSLDPASEALVQQALDWYRGLGKTVIVLAHRLKTVAACDVIFVLHDGVVAEQGTHQALLLAGGLYAKMWREYRGEI